MLTDGTYLSQMVSKQVRERCRPKMIATQPEDMRNSKKSATSIALYQSMKSINHESMMGSRNLLLEMDESEAFDLGNSEAQSEEFKGVCAMIEMMGYNELIQSLAERKTVPSQMVARSIEVYFAKVILSLTRLLIL